MEGKTDDDATVWCQLGEDITCPFFQDGARAVLSRASGEINVVEEGKDGGSVANTGGQPSGVVVDGDGTMFIADMATNAIVQMDRASMEMDVMVQEYEGKPFKVRRRSGRWEPQVVYTSESPVLTHTGLCLCCCCCCWWWCALLFTRRPATTGSEQCRV